MSNLFIILSLLLLSLFVIIPLVERFGRSRSNQDLRKLSRLIFPLLALLIILQIIEHFFL